MTDIELTIDSAEAERLNRTQAWLDRFQGEVAEKTLEVLQLQTEIKRLEGLVEGRDAEIGRLAEECRIVRGVLNEQVDWVAALRAELQKERGGWQEFQLLTTDQAVEIDALRAERDALIREFGQFKNEQRAFRSKLYNERDALRAEVERLRQLCKEAQRALLNGGGYSTQLMHDLNNAR